MSETLSDLFFTYKDTAPFLAALFLGLLTAISPCPLATNITAIGYLGKDISNKKRVFLNGLIYTLGRVISYSLVAVIIVLGASETGISSFFQIYGEKIAGPFLLIAGLFMAGVIRIPLPDIPLLKRFREGDSGKNYWNALLLGIIFALAFCPYSGVLYFGLLIPLTIATPNGLLLPVVFALSTGLPVLIFAWLIAFSISGVGGMYDRIRTFEKWFRRIVAILFIITGVYLILAAWTGINF